MSDYFDASGNRISDGLTARATDVNTLRDEVGAAFDLLPSAAALQFNNQNFAVDTSVSDNTYLVSLSSDPASYTDGLPISMRPIRTNTGAATINVNGLGVKSIRNASGLALSAGDIVVGIPVDLRYSTVTGFFHVAPNSAVSATAAAASAAAASTSASTATTQAGIATTQAGTATTQAGIATTQAGNASASASAASGSESTATTQAGIATTQAGIATTQASNASTSAGAAATSASTASTQAGTATTQASTATTQAGIATTQAGNALASANAAAASAAALPNAVTAGADKFLQTNATADGWDYHTAGDARTALGLAIGTDVQAYDADLTTWAGVTPGTGVATALAVNVGTAGAPVVNGGVLGTPSSGTVTNLTGTASININGTVGATTPAAATVTSLTDSGNLTFTGTGNRITGDFSNATRTSGVLFLTNTGGANRTQVGAIPPVGATQSQWELLNDADGTDCGLGQVLMSATEMSIRSSIQGTASYLPMTFYTGGSERMRIDTSGNVGIGVSPASGFRVDSFGGYFRHRNNVAINAAASDGTNSLMLQSDGSTGQCAIIAAGNSFLTFHTSASATPVERMRIDSYGQITGGNSAGATALALTSTTTSVNARIKLTTTSDTSSVAYVLANSHASINKQASMYLVSSNGGLQFQTGQTAGAEPTTGANAFRMQDDFAGVISPTAALGYGTGAGGTVTQGSGSGKATAVTLNKPTGQITMDAAALAAGAAVTFTLNNSLLGNTDTLVLSLFNSYTSGAYLYTADLCRAGSCAITFRNVIGGSLSEAVVLQFSVIKGATS